MPSSYLFENAGQSKSARKAVVPGSARGHSMLNTATADSTLAFFNGDQLVAQPQRLEIRLLGTVIRADGIAGIAGAILLVGLILIAYFGG
jgi:hypothetical protein